MDNFSWLNSADPEMIEDMYRSYKSDPASVDESWSKFFEGFDFARTDYKNQLSLKDCTLKSLRWSTWSMDTGNGDIFLLKQIRLEREELILPILIFKTSDLNQKILKQNFRLEVKLD